MRERSVGVSGHISKSVCAEEEEAVSVETRPREVDEGERLQAGTCIWEDQLVVTGTSAFPHELGDAVKLMRAACNLLSESGSPYAEGSAKLNL